MKRLENEAERLRRYSAALVTAALTVPRAAAWHEHVGGWTVAPARWRAQLSLPAGAVPAHRRALEA